MAELAGSKGCDLQHKVQVAPPPNSVPLRWYWGQRWLTCSLITWNMGLSAHEQEEWLIRQMVMLPFQSHGNSLDK